MGFQNENIKLFTKKQAGEIYKVGINEFNELGSMLKMEISEDILKVLIYSNCSEKHNKLIINSFKMTIFHILSINKDARFEDMFIPYLKNNNLYTLKFMKIV